MQHSIKTERTTGNPYLDTQVREPYMISLTSSLKSRPEHTTQPDHLESVSGLAPAPQGQRSVPSGSLVMSGDYAGRKASEYLHEYRTFAPHAADITGYTTAKLNGKSYKRPATSYCSISHAKGENTMTTLQDMADASNCLN